MSAPTDQAANFTAELGQPVPGFSGGVPVLHCELHSGHSLLFLVVYICCELNCVPQALLVTSPADTAEARTHLTQDEISITELFRENTPSVVFITNLASRSVAGTAGTAYTTAHA